MKRILTRSFFERPVVRVAEDLIGKFLVRGIGHEERAYMITEVEAYDGERDKACHASRGRTKRTEVMYGPAGHWYVYLCYGMYWMLNVVTGPMDYPAAVLIRGVESAGWQIHGPGKVTKVLAIDKRLNTLPASVASELWIEDRGIKIKRKQIKKTPRIGVSYAGPVWAKKQWRFVLENKSGGTKSRRIR